MHDGEMFAKAMTYFENGKFKHCHLLLKILAEKYECITPTHANANDILQLYCAYEVICVTMGMHNPYENKLFIMHSTISPELFQHARKMQCHSLLQKKEYDKVEELMPYLQQFTGPNISPETMSYFKKNDRDRTLLIYNSGGIGDIIMHSRFIPRVCESQPENRIMYLVNDELYWMFQAAFFGIRNLQVVQFTAFKTSPKKYDHHINVVMLFVHLKITYETLPDDPYLQHVRGSPLQLEGFIHPSKKNVVINWCGNKVNIMERFNRSIPLELLIPLFRRHADAVQFISVQKAVSPEEAAILDAHNVKNCGPLLDNAGDAFKDTVTLLKAVDLVITTDTSLVHLAGTMNVPCWCMLTIGCEWRWKPADHLWYPRVKPFRQTAVSSWDNVVADLSASLASLEGGSLI